jgi:hypothetical protein
VRAPLLALVVVGLAGCGAGDVAPAAAPTGSPAPTLAAAAPDPATAPLTIGEGTPAALALLAAARRTAAAGSFQVSVTAQAHGSGPGQSLTLSGVALSASPSRYRLSFDLNLDNRPSHSEAIGYDGRFWSRDADGAWIVQPAPRSNPRGYLTQLSGATQVVDAGPEVRGAATEERFTAHLDVTAAGSQPVAGATARSGELTAWVSPAGYLDAEHVLLYDGGGTQVGDLTIGLSAFGQPFTVEPPA